MGVTRRRFIQTAGVSAVGLGLKMEKPAAGPVQVGVRKRRRRTVYFNDARHYYLFVLSHR